LQRIEVALIRILNAFGDAVSFTLAFGLGLWIRSLSPYANERLGQLYNWRDLVILFLIFYLSNLAALMLNQAYPTSRIKSYDEMVKAYFKSVFLAMFAIVALAYFVHFMYVSRTLLFSATCFAFTFLSIKEALIRRWIARLRGSGRNQRFVLLIMSDDASLRHTAEQITAYPLLGLKVKGVMTLSGDPRSQICGLPNLGHVSCLTELVEDQVIDCVVFPERAPGFEEELKDAIWECEQRGLEVWLTLDYSETRIRSIGLERLKDISFISIKVGPRNYVGLLIKSMMDRVLSLAGLVLLVPLMVAIAIAIKTTSQGPVLFTQHRAGLNGRKFLFYKFRSMVTNADELKESIRHLNEMSGPVFKIKDDPRITKIGKFLRRTSLDELPQLWNVLRGDMSLVGPRPLVMMEAAKIKGHARRRLSFRPGITCLWQVGARNRVITFEEWAALDLKYIDEWSLWLDLKILLRTIPAVFKQTGM